MFVVLGTVLISADYSTGANPLSWALVAVQELVVSVVLALMLVTAVMTGEILTSDPYSDAGSYASYAKQLGTKANTKRVRRLTSSPRSLGDDDNPNVTHVR